MWKTIDREELFRRHRTSPASLLLVDVRDRDDYEEEHIKGAISIPLREVNMRARTLESDREIVVYCGSYTCQMSVKAAKILTGKGFNDVVEYEGGLLDWKGAGLPTEGKSKARAA
jgi:rhodanese-related sulfurtransferase